MSEHGSIWFQSAQPSSGTATTALWFNPSSGALKYLSAQNPDTWSLLPGTQATAVSACSTSLGVPALLTFAASATDLTSVITTLNSVIAVLKTAGLMATS
jgi:hypothetical protein